LYSYLSELNSNRQILLELDKKINQKQNTLNKKTDDENQEETSFNDDSDDK
jgi:hypothetical protein